MPLTRRQFLGAAAGVSSAAALAGCGFVPQHDSTTTDKNTLAFTTWGTDAELAGLRKAIAGFEAAHRGKKVALNSVPYAQMFTNLDAQIQAGNPPDIFRVPYYTLGAYAGRGQLLDVGSRVPADFADRFTPGAWAAVQGRGHAVGVPHHTDTSVILYNRSLLSKAGITDIPTKIEDSWTWDEFEQVLTKLRSSLPDSKYPLVVNWQGNGVTRWLTWLFESNGRFLNSDRDKAAIDSDPGRAAVDFTKNFFPKKFVPPNSSVKSTALAADTWFKQTAAMTFAGAFLLPDAKTTATFDWGATFAPRNKRSASDFGGNALVATAATNKPDLAVAFFDWVTRADVQREFCVAASLLPTRRDLVASGITFTVRPELSPVFTGQARTVQAADSTQVASPSMSDIITVLKDQLEDAFVGGQSTSSTLSGISGGINTALKA